NFGFVAPLRKIGHTFNQRGHEGRIKGEASGCNLEALVTAEVIEPDQKLHRVNAGIRLGESGIGDVNVAQREYGIPFATEVLQTDRRPRRKVHIRSAEGDFMVGVEASTADFDIRSNPPMRIKVPLEDNRVNVCPN